jgi:hypothetical protein
MSPLTTGFNVLPFEADPSLNNIYEFSPYRKESTIFNHYKDLMVNAV